tara:strand:+ start:116 stop:232 length:117 start_codon:yes stop_codon:yes gene_type:complete
MSDTEKNEEGSQIIDEKAEEGAETKEAVIEGTTYNIEK